MVVDNPTLWSLKQGSPEVIGAFTIDSAHSAGYGVGYLTNPSATPLGMTTHFSYDTELLGETIAEVRTRYKGNGAFGFDHQVVKLLIFFGAGDRDRTGDIQLGKLTFCH
jgi:hypothetical protein